jgi:sugar/nucleoside kinase (ribokinase family)
MTGEILVAGVVNHSTTVRIGAFPLTYDPVRYPRHGVHGRVAGVGWNHAAALTSLGERVRLLSFAGQDPPGLAVRAACASLGVDARLAEAPETAQAVVLVDDDGRRQVHTDLKDLPGATLPPGAERALDGCALAVLTNIGFTRALLAPARGRGIPIATDVHALADLDDPYNQELIAAATVLFASAERLPGTPEACAAGLLERYPCEIVVLGLGGEGCLLAVRRDGFIGRLAAVAPRGVTDTTGAGDALASAFLSAWARTGDPYLAAGEAVVFAGWKAGAPPGDDGWLDAGELRRLHAAHAPPWVPPPP